MNQPSPQALFDLEQEIKLFINQRLLDSGAITPAVYDKAKILLVKEQQPKQHTYKQGRVS